VNPGGYVRLFANQNSGGLDFKLPAEGATIKDYDSLGNVLQQVSYGAQAEGVSEGRFPDGASSIVDFAYATPGAANTLNFPVSFAVTEIDTLTLSWPAIVGTKFQVQAANNLGLPANWQDVADVTASNNSPFANVSVGAGDQFFRVVRVP